MCLCVQSLVISFDDDVMGVISIYVYVYYYCCCCYFYDVNRIYGDERVSESDGDDESYCDALMMMMKMYDDALAYNRRVRRIAHVEMACL